MIMFHHVNYHYLSCSLIFHDCHGPSFTVKWDDMGPRPPMRCRHHQAWAETAETQRGRGSFPGPFRLPAKPTALLIDGTTRNVSRVLSIRMRFCVEFQPHADLCSNTRSFWISEVSEVVWGDLWRLWAGPTGPTGPTGPRGSVRVSRGVSAGTVPAVRSVMRI